MGENWVYLLLIPLFFIYGFAISINIKEINKGKFIPSLLNRNLAILFEVGWIVLFITSITFFIKAINEIYAALSPQYLSSIYEVFNLNKIEHLREYFSKNVLLSELNALSNYSGIFVLAAVIIISFKCVIIEGYKVLKKGYYK